jgi:carbon starvation protein
MTIPIALFMGFYLRVLRPGRVLETSAIGVRLLLAPRDYLSTFMKVGTIGLLAVGILFTLPVLQNQAVTKFASSGRAPVFAGPLFPFVFIIIACGALSGFHALISSGTTPKLIEKESQVRMAGYGAMLTESFVAVMAMVAASILDQGLYFAMNSPPGVVGPPSSRPPRRSPTSASPSPPTSCSRPPSRSRSRP